MQDFEQIMKSFLDKVSAIVVMEDIEPELIYNWDQTGVNIVPSSSWTLERKGPQCVEIAGLGDKRQITALLCGTLTGDFLPVQMIYKGKTGRCYPKFSFAEGWNITHSPKHWSTMYQKFSFLR